MHPMLFDREFYADSNPDIGSFDPLDHYLRYGLQEGRAPHPLFWVDQYLKKNPDVRESGMNPVEHYLEFGWVENKFPHLLIDPHMLRMKMERIARAPIEGPPLVAYIGERRFWGVSPHPLFDADYYAAGFSGELPQMPLLAHYLKVGWKQGRQPHPLFSPDFYLGRYKDVAAAGVEPLSHFVEYGIDEFRQTHPLLNPNEYVKRVPECGGEHPLLHYIAHKGRWPANAWLNEESMRTQMSAILGKSFVGNVLDAYLRDQRYRLVSPNLLFDPEYYLVHRGSTRIEPPLVDYLVYGSQLGCNPHPVVDEPWYQRQFLSAQFGAAIEHYLAEAHEWGYTPTIYFDEKYYKEANKNVSGPGLLHYLMYGEKNSLRPNAYFSPLYYVNAAVPGLPQQGALLHFVEQGDRHGLRPSPEFDPVFYNSCYAIELRGKPPLSHFLQFGRFHGHLPARKQPIGRMARGWLAARNDRHDILNVAESTSPIAWISLLAAPDQRLLIEEAIAVSGDGLIWHALGPKPSAATFVECVSRLDDRAHVAIVQSEALIARTDVHRLASSLDENTADTAALPLSVAPDLSLVNPPTTPHGVLIAAFAELDHPDFNFRREVSVRGAAVAMFRRASLMRILGRMEPAEEIDLDRLLAAASPGVFLAPGAAVRVPHSAAAVAPIPHPPAAPTTGRRRSILYVDSTIPQPDKDAGSDTAWRVLKIMTELGFDVTFIPATVSVSHAKYIEAVRRLGVRVIPAPYIRNIADFISHTDEVFDIAFLSRAPVVASVFEPIRKKWPACRIIFNTVDIHYLRMLREATLHQNTSLFADSIAMKNLELGLIEKADQTIVLSEAEIDLLREEGIDAPVVVIPPVYDAARFYPYDPAARAGVFFVGGYLHAPNVDAVDYFVTDVWPLVTAERPDLVFHVVGANAPGHFSDYASDTVKIVGFVDDLDKFMSGMRLMVSPLRYGAGVKVKVVASLSAGVPAIVTSPSIEGAGIAPGDGYRLADSSEALAREIIQLYDNISELAQLSSRGMAAVKARYSMDTLRNTYRKILLDDAPRRKRH